MALAAVVTLLLAHELQGQISITGGGLSYSQNFDTLTRSTTAENLINNSEATSVNDSPQLAGLLGWYAAGFASQNALTPNSYVPQILAGTGSSGTGSFYSYGAVAASDRALGTLPTDGTTGAGAGALRVGVRFVNNTGDYLSGFTFSYDGEQWRNPGTGATLVNNQFSVGYAVFSAGFGTLATTNSLLQSYDLTPAANFNTPFDGTGTGTSAPLDGNDPANRIAGLGDTITGLSIAPGDEIWIRWSDANSTSLDAGIGIDNFSVTFAVPEPSTAVLLSLGMVFIMNRARHRRH